MKTEYEKMRSQELYYFSDPEIHASLVHAKKVCARLRSMTIYDGDPSGDRRTDSRYTAKHYHLSAFSL